MALVTGGSGLALGAGAGYLLSVIMRNQFSGWGNLLGVILGIMLFYPAGVILGLITFKILHYEGSLLLGITGVVVCELMTFGLGYLFRAPVGLGVLIPAFLVLAPLMASLGYHMDRNI